MTRTQKAVIWAKGTSMPEKDAKIPRKMGFMRAACHSLPDREAVA